MFKLIFKIVLCVIMLVGLVTLMTKNSDQIFSDAKASVVKVRNFTGKQMEKVSEYVKD